MKLLVAILSAALAVPASPFLMEIAELPTDAFEGALGGIDLAVATGAVAPGMADIARASLALAQTPMSPGDTVRAAAQLSAQLDAARGVDPSATSASATRSARILDLVDVEPHASAADILRLTQEVARIHAGQPDGPANTLLQFDTPSLALHAIVDASGQAWTDTMARDAATLDGLAEPTRTGVLTILDTHVTARARVEAGESLGIPYDARAFLTERVAIAMPSLRATLNDIDLVECGVYDLRLGTADSLHTCPESSFVALDLGGNDTYHADGGELNLQCLLPPCVAFAIAIDTSGDDDYTSEGATRDWTRILGSSSLVGFSAFFELDGTDTYHVTHGVNGAWGTGPRGLFVDLAGNDSYNGADSYFSTAFGADNGIFIDGNGDDVYSAGDCWQCAGVLGGIAIDFGGADSWNFETAYSEGSFGALENGLFVDVGDGDDTYVTSGSLYVFGGCSRLSCVFRDGGGENVFTATSGPAGAAAMGAAWVGSIVSDGNPLRASAIGLMLVGAGDDAYDFTGTENPSRPSRPMGAATNGVGGLVDEGGNNTYVIRGVAELAQGAARDGVGFFVDRGGNASIALEQGVGQGSGIRGVGIIVRTNGEASTTYSTGPSALTSLTSGGGIGLRIHRGPVELFGGLPDFTCSENSTTIAGAGGIVLLDRRIVEAYLCAPDGEAGEQIVNPVTQEDVDDLPRPAVQCSSGPLGDQGCAQIVGDAWGPGAVDWLDDETFTMRTSGGFSWLSAAGQLSTKFELHSVDNACKISCASWDNIDRIG